MVRQMRQAADAYGSFSSFVPSVMSLIPEVSVLLLLNSGQKERAVPLPEIH